jgi:hypothetical protein
MYPEEYVELVRPKEEVVDRGPVVEERKRQAPVVAVEPLSDSI